jgi:hypothetical protein
MGRPTLFNGEPATTRLCRDLKDAILATTSPALFDDDQLHAFEHLDGAVRSTVLGGDCYNYGCVASGWLDVVVEAGLKLHDFAALVPIVEGAGGRMCDWQGDPLTADSKGEVIAAGDPARIDADLAVAIRTFTVLGSGTAGCTHFSVGGGIVADSRPHAEWAETELKAARLLAVAGAESATRAAS